MRFLTDKGKELGGVVVGKRQDWWRDADITPLLDSVYLENRARVRLGF